MTREFMCRNFPPRILLATLALLLCASQCFAILGVWRRHARRWAIVGTAAAASSAGKAEAAEAAPAQQAAAETTAPEAVAAASPAVAQLPAAPVAQSSGMQQQIQQSVAENKQKLAHYTWQEQQTVLLKGEVKSQTLYQVQMGPDGKPQKTQLSAPPPPPEGRRLKERIIEKKTEELKQYAQQISALVHSYVPPNPQKMQQAFQQGSGSLSRSGAGAVQLSFSNYNQQGDSMTLVFNTEPRGLQSAQVSSYLNNDPKDAVTFSAQFARLPDGTNYMSSATVNGEKEHLTIQIQNMNYQPL